MQLEKRKMIAAEPENSSGQGNSAIVPAEILGWNWGASLLGWLWAIGNNRLDMAAYGLAAYTCSVLLGPVGWLAQLIVSIILGVKGNEWAWQGKKWHSVGRFKNNQKKWRKWGIAASILNVILMLWVGIAGFGIWRI